MASLPRVPEIIDVHFGGQARAVGAWVTDDVIIDPGPAAGLEDLLAGLDGREPRAILLTHIHLDHAGAAGHLAERFPAMPVYVHEIGAPHIADPERLVASSKRVFGDRFARLGDPLPVPAERINTIGDGDVAEGLRAVHTPGHAGNHLAYFDEASGDLFAGDVAGVSIEPEPATIMPTPPPEIDLDAWLASVDRVAGLGPATLRLTHYGTVAEPVAHLDHCRELLHAYAELARAGDRAAFESALRAEVGERGDSGTLEAVVSAGDAWAGLERWATKFPA